MAELKASIARNDACAGIASWSCSYVPLNPSKNRSSTPRVSVLDLLATLVAFVQPDGSVLFANSALEDAIGTQSAPHGQGLAVSRLSPNRSLHTALEGAGVMSLLHCATTPGNGANHDAGAGYV